MYFEFEVGVENSALADHQRRRLEGLVEVDDTAETAAISLISGFALPFELVLLPLQPFLKQVDQRLRRSERRQLS